MRPYRRDAECGPEPVKRATAALVLLLAGPASGQIELERLVGSGDVLPGLPPGATIAVAFQPHVAGENVAFYAAAFAGDELIEGVWVWDGQVFHRVLDSTMVLGIQRCR